MKLLLIVLLLLAIPVLAVHTSDVSVVPQLSGASKETNFSFNITNNGKDSINEVRIRIPVEFSALKCGTAPNGWSLAYSDAIECNYKTVSNYLSTGKSLIFVITATAASKDGNYTWEVRSRDVFDGFSLHNPTSAVDATGPTIKTTTLNVPNGGEKWEVLSQYNILWSSSDIADSNLKNKPMTLEYTTDGRLWNEIAKNEENDGTYTWTVPDVKSDKARVRISVEDTLGNTASDESDSSFSIIPAVPVVAIGIGETKTLDVNKDGKNDTTIKLRSVSEDAAVLLIAGIAAPSTPAPNATSNATATPAPSPEKGILTNPTVTAVVVILILIILYLIWRLNQLEKKKK